jgi:UDPglucose 6-dehydrogenase
MMKIAYIGGLGRLGLPLAAWSASRGFAVICSDKSIQRIEQVSARKSPYMEGGLQTLLDSVNMNYTDDNVQAAALASLVFVIVPTPSLEDGSFSTVHVLDACEDIGRAIRLSADYKVVIIVSTTNPGDMDGSIKAILEKSSGQRAGVNFGLVYSPEFVKQGSIIHDFSGPCQVLIGEFDERSGSLAQYYYNKVTINDPPVRRMSLINAEIAKLGLNATLTTKLGLANQMAWLCHHIPGADARVVLDAIGADERIGSKFFKAGTRPGGPCLPRDCKALWRAGMKATCPPILADATTFFHAKQDTMLLNMVRNYAAERPIGVVGLTYKIGVDILEESVGAALADDLVNHGCEVYTYDPNPLVQGTCNYFEELVAKAEVLVFMLPYDWMSLALADVDLSEKVIIDMWGDLDDDRIKCAEYIRFGKGE